jgi:hypothetical protein
MMDCDRAARYAAESEPTKAVLKAAEIETQRLIKIGRDIYNPELYAYAIALRMQKRMRLRKISRGPRLG